MLNGYKLTLDPYTEDRSLFVSFFYDKKNLKVLSGAQSGAGGRRSDLEEKNI